MEDSRGQLTQRFLDIASRYTPRWVVWENVPGVLSIEKGLVFGSFLGGLAKLGYGFAYRILDAQYFGLAQRRERVFVVGCAGGEWQRAAAVLFDAASLRGNPPPSRHSGQDVAPTINSRLKGGGGLGTDAECDGCLIAHTFTSEGHDASEDGSGCGVPLVAMAANSRSNRYDAESQTLIPHSAIAFTERTSKEGRNFESQEDLAYAVTNPGSGGRTHSRQLYDGAGVRRLTPTEVERLFGFQDSYTAIPWRGKPATQCPDSPRYRALGNSMAVPVMQWIGRRIAII